MVLKKKYFSNFLWLGGKWILPPILLVLRLTFVQLNGREERVREQLFFLINNRYFFFITSEIVYNHIINFPRHGFKSLSVCDMNFNFVTTFFQSKFNLGDAYTIRYMKLYKIRKVECLYTGTLSGGNGTLSSRKRDRYPLWNGMNILWKTGQTSSVKRDRYPLWNGTNILN